jgi:hypothetical protein
VQHGSNRHAKRRTIATGAARSKPRETLKKAFAISRLTGPVLTAKVSD